MADLKLAEQFRALGDPTRLRIFRLLTAHSGEGMTAGEVCQSVCGAAKITSTVSHHLKELRNAGLIQVRRSGVKRIFQARPDGVRDMISLLLDVE